MKKILAVMTFLFLLSSSTVLAETCNGDFDCDGDVDGSDVIKLKIDFGRGQFNNPCDPCPPQAGAVPKTGQTACYDSDGNVIDCAGTGQDGEYQKGVEWPNPRFTDNGNGTVTDNLTGLIWLRDALCFGGGGQVFLDALSAANGLASGSCGLTDGSIAGDWRLPNLRELQSLADYAEFDPALPPGHPFVNVESMWYISSTTTNWIPNAGVWFVDMLNGKLETWDKYAEGFVWPVRGGQ